MAEFGAIVAWEVALRVEDRIANLLGMSSLERKAEWRKLFGKPAPPAFGSGLLTRAIAANWQERARGGLSKSEIRRICKFNKAASGLSPAKAASRLEIGTILSRTWRGHEHIVQLSGEGFEYLGLKYDSLSEIARLITGARWSGPRFFGLTSLNLKRLEHV